jgi:hypothetical protein
MDIMGEEKGDGVIARKGLKAVAECLFPGRIQGHGIWPIDPSPPKGMNDYLISGDPGRARACIFNDQVPAMGEITPCVPFLAF